MTDRSRLRLVVLGVLIISLVMTLIGRLWYLQVLAAPQYRSAALDNQTRDIVTQAPRGEIVDDKGRPLVTNKTALVITVDRMALDRQTDDGKAVIRRLSRLIGTPLPLLTKQTTDCLYPKVNGVKVARPLHCWSGAPSQPIPVSQVKPSVAATKTALQIDELQEKYPGVSAQLTAVRQYPQPLGAQASTILGYTAPISSTDLDKLSDHKQTILRNSRVGVTGLEQQYNKVLSGKPGIREILVDHVGAQTGVVKDTEPRQGNDIVTNLDAKAQATLETEVQAALTKAHNSGLTGDYAAGVVLNAQTGGIVAMASEPTYNPSHPPPTLSKARYHHLSYDLPSNPFYDKAYEASAPAGSTFKPISATGLIYDGTLNPSVPYDCPTNFGNRQNFEGGSGKGLISLHEALVVSCDTFFFSLGKTDYDRDESLIHSGHKPREGVQRIARAFGYGSPSRSYVDLPSAATGHIADRYNTKKQWEATKAAYCKGAQNQSFTAYHRALDSDYCKYGDIFLPGEQENEDVGQGTVLASPLQVAVAYAAIANGGKVFEPRVAKAILSPTGKLIKRIKAPVRDHLPVSPANLAYIKSALLGVIGEPSGTAHGAFAGFPLSQVSVGGKTGTAELTGTDENGSWFASFGGPAGQPSQYVTVIEVDKSDQGAISAAPFVKNMWDAIYGFNGHHAIFPNGVPPTALPKVGAARAQAMATHKAKLHRQERRLHRQQQNTGTTGTPTPGSTPTAGTTP